jgi:hypothetical protein
MKQAKLPRKTKKALKIGIIKGTEWKSKECIIYGAVLNVAKNKYKLHFALMTKSARNRFVKT